MEETGIREMQQKMASGEVTALGLTQGYLERIEALDRQGPALHAVLETNPDALAIAEGLDKERREGKTRGPLHGVPILIKDNIDTHDRMLTTAGSAALEDSTPRRDAFIARRLRAAGAVILGKANLSEWANFRSTRSVSGWSSRGGLTRNPYALDRTACGSSTGSAVAVAADLCAAAVGTETDGSIICPSQTNGIVGLKPTLGLLSRSGIIPIAHSQDTPGPMARTVEDLAILLGPLTGLDPRDPATRASQKRRRKDYTRFLDPQGLQGARLGVARNMLGTDKRLVRILDASLDLMKRLGAVIIDPADVPNFDGFGPTEVEVLLFEFKADLNRYLAARGPEARVHSMEDVIRFNEDHRRRVMPYFGQERMEQAQEKGPLTSEKYRRALSRNRRLTRREGLDAVLRKHRLDAILAISGGPAWTLDMVNGDARSWDMESTSPPAVAGYPHITVPAGFVSGLPIGLSFIAKAWQEPVLIRLAFAFEQASQIRRPPRFLLTADSGGDETSAAARSLPAPDSSVDSSIAS
jgi:amidase